MLESYQTSVRKSSLNRRPIIQFSLQAPPPPPPSPSSSSFQHNLRMPLPAALSPLGQPNFRLLWIGQGISSAVDALVPVALAFATLSIARSASPLGLVLATSTLARVISLPIGGVWADRLPRQRVMLASDVIRGLVQAAIAALLMTHTAQLWHLVLGGVVFNFAGGFFQPASTALTPLTVDAQTLQQANALMGRTRSTVW